MPGDTSHLISNSNQLEEFWWSLGKGSCGRRAANNESSSNLLLGEFGGAWEFSGARAE